MTANCWAIRRATGLAVVGLCHGTFDVQRQLGVHCMEVDYQRALELALSRRGPAPQ